MKKNDLVLFNGVPYVVFESFEVTGLGGTSYSSRIKHPGKPRITVYNDKLTVIEAPVGFVIEGQIRLPKEGDWYIGSYSTNKPYKADFDFDNVNCVILKKEEEKKESKKEPMKEGTWCRIPRQYRQEIQDEFRTPGDSRYSDFSNIGGGLLRVSSDGGIKYNLATQCNDKDEISHILFLENAKEMGWSTPDFSDWVDSADYSGEVPMKTVWKNPSKELAKLLQEDEDYAWTWHCNIVMPIIDEGASHEVANRAAARAMSNIFQVDITKSGYFQAFESMWKEDKLTAREPTEYEKEIDNLQQTIDEQNIKIKDLTGKKLQIFGGKPYIVTGGILTPSDTRGLIDCKIEEGDSKDYPQLELETDAIVTNCIFTTTENISKKTIWKRLFG